MDSQPPQAFYVPHLNRSANIPLRYDNSRKCSIVLWRDVERFCPHARYAMVGEDIVPFLSDDDFNEYVDQLHSTAPLAPHQASASNHPNPSPRPTIASVPSLPSTALGPTQSENRTGPKEGCSSTAYPPSRAKFSPACNLALSMSNPSSVFNIKIGTASGSNTATETLYLSATAATTGLDSILGSQVVPSALVTRQEGITIAHSEGQSSIDVKARVEKYSKHLRESEWHEAPSPRLFIVMPAASASEGYLLYWLCEDFSSGDLIPHLTHEPGIELRRPGQFFRTYGEMLLIGLYLFKATKDIITDDGGWYDQGMSFLTRDLGCPRELAELDINRMINRLHESLSSHGISGKMAQTASESLPQNSDDMYGIRYFLKNRSFSSKLSNERHHGLYRLVGDEGNIQWICSTHFYQARSEDFDPPFIQHILKDYGAYDVQRGLVAAQVRSKTAANAMNCIYDAAVREFDSVSEFSLHLGWEASDPDLDELCSTVAGFNLVSVVLTSPNLRQMQPVLANPIRHIFKCNRIQSFGLGNLCEDRMLFDSLLLAKRSPKLKSLRLALDAKGWDCQAIKENFDRILGNLPVMEKLDVAWDEIEQVSHLESALRSFAAGMCQAHKVTMRGETQEVTLILDHSEHLATHSSLFWTRIP
ncbi:hypothetical protein EC968_008921 [Mortierella alpina]|nr:hypothetical protein EC968_008921 [Mortierella alpina]